MKTIRFLIILLLHFFSSVMMNGQVVGSEKDIKAYYVSSYVGNDRNNGLSPDKPKKHISAIGEKDNIIIRLKCNDTYFEQLRDYSNSTIESYGEGERPVICGFKVLLNSEAWEYDSQHGLWRIDLQQKDVFGGMLKGDEPNDRINNVGFIYDANNDEVYGHLVQHMTSMNQDGDFYISNHANTDAINKDTFRYLYWKISGNPKHMGKICFPMALVALRGMNNCIIKNIAIVGFSKFGIAQSSNIIVENCQIDLIGGALQIGKRDDWVRYGNGIEFWWTCKNGSVRNCLISRTYDCGTSIQGQGEITGSPTNIHFENNKFYHCRQAFEFFLKPSNDYKPDYINCSFINNICFEMGENEFSTPELRDANLLSYDHTPKNMKITGNIFWGAPHFCGSVYPFGMRDNLVYIFKGQYLNIISTNLLIIASGSRELNAYRNRTNDISTVKVLNRGSSRSKRLEKRIRAKIGWKPVDLHLGYL